MNCPGCGAWNSSTTRYCGNCGKPLASTCPGCDFDNPIGFRYCGQCGGALPTGEQGRALQDAAQERARGHDREPERRMLSVMFCDLVGSIGMSRNMELEDWRDLLRTYQDTASRCIRAHGGFISRYFGDGILALFGYPRAEENDAERAVRGGLAVTQAVEQMNSGTLRRARSDAKVRVAIATGLVVVGDIIGEGTAQEEAVVGETPNRAARLQQAAEPNTVIIDLTTRELLGDLFRLHELGDIELKGFPEGIPAWRVTAAEDFESRFRATRRDKLTPVVDRAPELDDLLQRWGRSRAGEGQLVLLQGEPGIGKSRLVDELGNRISHPFTPLLYQCSPMHSSSALYPFMVQLRRAAGIQRGDADDLRLRKLDALVPGTGEAKEAAVGRLADLLSIPVHTHDATPAAIESPSEKRVRLLNVLRGLLEASSKRRPVLMVFEDVQWIDPTSMELLDVMVGDIAGQPVLAVVTHRPEFTPPWIGKPHVSTHTLGRLPAHDVEAMIEQVAGAGRLSGTVTQQLVRRTDGIPLFIEEMVVTLVDTPTLDQSHRGGGSPGPDVPSAIPATLQASLLARLDRLAEAKRLAQIASVIGREFTRELLSSVADWTTRRLEELLVRLIESGLVYATAATPGAAYCFKHALVRDVAYASLLRGDRLRFHRRVAEALETQYYELTRFHPELVAYHYTEGDVIEKALEYWLIAGTGAAARSANTEAIIHLTKGMRLLRRLPDTVTRRQLELELLVARGPALINTRGPGTRSAKRTYDRALALCRQLDESDLHFAAYWGSLRIDESYRSKLKRVEELQRLGESLAEPGYVLQAHHRQWATLFHLARHEECCTHIRRGLAIYDAGDYTDHGLKYAGHDPKVCAHGEAALASWLLGDLGSALTHIEQALDWARRLQHAGSIAHAMDIACMLHRYRRDEVAVRDQALEMLDFAREHRMSDHASKARLFLGWARARQGETALGLEWLEEEMALQERTNTPEDFPVFFESLAEVLAESARIDDATAVLERGFSIMRRSEILYWNAELHRRQGDLRRRRDGGDPSIASCYETAIVCAREQGALSLELRAALDLVRLARRADRPERGREILAPVLERFAPDADCAELREARSLIAAPS